MSMGSESADTSGDWRAQRCVVGAAIVVQADGDRPAIDFEHEAGAVRIDPGFGRISGSMSGSGPRPYG